MIKNKLYKYKKLIVCVMVVLGIALACVCNAKLGSHINTGDMHHTYTGLSYIKDSQLIDKELVVKSLSHAQQLVTLDGDISKNLTYTDSLFKQHGWLKDVIGQRSLTMDVHAFFKTGINLGDINPDDVSVYKNTVFLKVPKHVLVSLDVPYNEIIFKTKTGLLRSEVSEAEKQQLYSEIRRIITDNIMSDKAIEAKTITGVTDALSNLLSKIPNVNRVVIQGKTV